MPKPRNGNVAGPSEAQKLQFKCIARLSKAPDPYAFEWAHENAESQELFWRDIVEMAFYGTVRSPDDEAKIVTPTAKVTRLTNQTPASATDTAIIFTAQVWDNNNFWDSGVNPSRLTALTPGLYLIGGCLNWPQGSGAERIARIRKNGSTQLTAANAVYSGGSHGFKNVMVIEYLNSGDYVELIDWDNSSNRNVQAVSFWIIGITPEQAQA